MNTLPNLFIAIVVFSMAALVEPHRILKADDIDLKKRYFRLYMEYQDVEISGTIKEQTDVGPVMHEFVLRYGASQDGKAPPMEILSILPNPGEPHIASKTLVDEAFAISSDFINVQFQRQYISTHRYDKFNLIDPESRNDVKQAKERFSKAYRFSNIYLNSGATSPPGYFYAIHESVQMGLDGHDTKVYWGNEKKYESGTTFEVIGSEQLLGYPCKRVRYRDLQGITIDALIATDPSIQVFKVLEVSGPPDILKEDSKTIWLNLPKTESIKRFGRWLIRDRVTYSDRDWSWEVNITDVKPLSGNYEGLWINYNKLTGCRVSGPAEPQTRKGTARAPIKGVKGSTMVPYTDAELQSINEYLAKQPPLSKPKPSLSRMTFIGFNVIAAIGLIIFVVKRYKRK